MSNDVIIGTWVILSMCFAISSLFGVAFEPITATWSVPSPLLMASKANRHNTTFVEIESILNIIKATVIKDLVTSKCHLNLMTSLPALSQAYVFSGSSQLITAEILLGIELFTSQLIVKLCIVIPIPNFPSFKYRN